MARGPGLAYAAVPGAWLILPTYNEAENIEAIVAAALRAPALDRGREHRILIVDDGSPDGTGEIADRLAAEHDRGGGAPPPRQGRASAGLPRRLRAARSRAAPTS